MQITFAKNIKELREHKNLSQQDLAIALSTTQRKVSYWENGKVEPDLAMLWLIADYFDVSIDYLIGRNLF